MVEAGDKIPDFKLLTVDRDEFTPETIAGKRSLFCFYPFAFSGPCNDQLSLYQRQIEDFNAKGVDLYAISVDSWHGQRAFQKHLGAHGITFLADFEPKGAAAKAFGVFRDDGFNDRSVVLIEPDGTVGWSKKMPVPGEIPPADEILANL